MTEYLRLSGMYWGLTVMDLMHNLDQMNKDEVLDFVRQCQHECGGFGASVGHDPHMLYTLSAIQVGNTNGIIHVQDGFRQTQYRRVIESSHLAIPQILFLLI